MIGSIAGDMIGSVYEHHAIKTTVFPLFSQYARFTDDTVLTIAVADALMSDGDYAGKIKAFARRYPNAGYGGTFYRWMMSAETAPYGSFGNGSAMRVSPVGFACTTVDEVLQEAKRSADVSHSHPEGIKGAQAVALAIYLARTGESKDTIRHEIAARFGYDLNRTVDQIRPVYDFDVTCQGSVPESIIAFLDAADYEDTVRKAISLGGDSDTQACIAGGIAQAFYGGIPNNIAVWARGLLTPDLKNIVLNFESRFPPPPVA